MMEDRVPWLLEPMSYYRVSDDPRSEYFQVERDVEDDIFLQQIVYNELKHINYHHNNNINVKKFNKVVENQVVWKLLENSHLWKSLHVLAKQSNQYQYFDSAIRASATLVYLLYTKDYLYECGRMRSSFKQLNILWEHYFARAGKQKCRIDDVFKSLLRDKIPKDKFFYVTEYWLDQLSSSYATGLTIPPMFDEPAMSYHLILRKTPTFDYIKKIVTQMKYPPTFKVDDYTRMLIKFARRDGIKYEEILLTRAVELVDTEALHNHYPDSCPEEESESPLKDLDVKLMYFIEYLIQDLKSDVNEWVSGVLTPLHALLRPIINAVDEPGNYLFISANVYELIEVAELRRKAVGSRFISRNHLMWAFYECGYGLPPKIRKSINLNTDHDDDEDHPPYHIYMTSIKLAESFEEKKLLLEHFVFVILYMKDVDIDDEMQVIKMQNRFKNFLKDLKSIERPKVLRSQFESKEHYSCFDSCGLKNPTGVEDLKKTLKSGKLESLVRIADSMIA